MRILALLVWALALLNVWSALFAHGRGRLELVRQYLPLEVMHGSRLLTVVVGFLLLFLGHGLWRHKRRAWQAAVAILGPSAVLHLVKGLDWEESLGSLLVLGALLALRDRFRAASDPPSLRRGLAVLGVTALFACVYGTLGFYYLDAQFHARFELGDSLLQTLRVFLVFAEVPVPHTGRAAWFLDSLYLIGALSLVYGVSSALRPVVYRSRIWEGERQRAAEIVARHGRSSLARMTLFPDKTFFFPPGLDAYLAFRVEGNVAVVLGDPIAPEQEVPHAIAAFDAYCAEMDWTPCYYQVLPDFLRTYRQAGYQALKIGEEAILDLATFSLQGGARKDLRGTVNKLARSGFVARFYHPGAEAGDEQMAELKEVSDQWLRQMQTREKRFSLGWFDSAYLKDTDLQVILSPQGRVEAFANYFTQYQEPLITPDLMRRRSDAERGVMEFLFVRAAEHYRERGFTGLNLGLAPLAGVGEGAGAAAPERVLRLVYEHFNRFYSFRGLHAFKQKFHPRWEPRYLVYPSVASLPKAQMAIVRANNPGLLWRA